MKIFSVYSILILLCATAFAQQQSKWSISDYVRDLPSKYTSPGDDLSHDETVTDDKTGYVAFLDSVYGKNEPIIEFALFTQAYGEPILVISRMKTDLGCKFYESYFLQKQNDKWTDVKEKVLPNITESLFFPNAESFKNYKKIRDKNKDLLSDIEYQFIPPQKGTRMKVATNICTDLSDEPPEFEEMGEYNKLLESTKSFYLQWNKNNGVFELSGSSAKNKIKQTNWKISDYLENLPEKYKTFYGDIDTSPESFKKIVDDKNGYVAFVQSEAVWFEMALFKPQKGIPTLVISNYQEDGVCSEFETFFLQKKGLDWVDVKSLVAPTLTQSMFFTKKTAAKKFGNLQKIYGDRMGGFDYKYSLPRNGTRIKVSPVFCDWVDEEPAVPSRPERRDEEPEDFLNFTKPIFLKWNKSAGKFEFAK